MKVLYSNAKRLILILFAMVVLLVSTSSTAFAYASELRYSDVLTDLTNDSNFNVEDYPAVDDDYSLKLIHLAESTDDEVLLYVYHPSATKRFLPATYVRIAINGISTVTDYSLSLVSQSGVFAKYVVNGLTVNDNETRIYEVVCLFREWVKGIDEEPTGDNTVSAVPFDVSKKFYITTGEGNLTYSSTFDMETIEVTDKFVGYVRCTGGLPPFYESSCDSHFIAFSLPSDYLISGLVSARVEFRHQYYSMVISNTGYFNDTYMGVVDDFAELHETQTGGFDGGLFYPEYKWNRIQTVSDFLLNPGGIVYNNVVLGSNLGTELTDEAFNELLGKQWVLRFYESSYSTSYFNGTSTFVCQLVSDVTLLRLEFESMGKTYNLGVVDNYQTGSRKPAGVFGGCSFGWKEIIFLIILLVLVVLLILFGPRIFLWIIEVVLQLLLWIIKGLWWLICAPFKWIFGKHKDDESEKGGGK